MKGLNWLKLTWGETTDFCTPMTSSERNVENIVNTAFLHLPIYCVKFLRVKFSFLCKFALAAFSLVLSFHVCPETSVYCFIPWLCHQFLNGAFFFFHREHKAVIVNHFLGDKLLCAATDELIDSYTPQGEGKIKR